jgi:hypothetical protein
MKSWPALDPNEILDFEIDWVEDGALEDSELILTSTWAVEQGTVTILDSAPHVSTNNSTSGITKVWLTGGTLGEVCILTNTITTDATRTKQCGAKLKIKSKGA